MSGGRRTGFARESVRPQLPFPQRERHEDPGAGDRAGPPVLRGGHHGAHERCTGYTRQGQDRRLRPGGPSPGLLAQV